MFLINLCLAHQNVVLRRKLIKKQSHASPATDEINSRRLQLSQKIIQARGRVGCKIWKLIAITPVKQSMFNTWGKKIILGFFLFLFFFYMCLFFISGYIDLVSGLTMISLLSCLISFQLLFIQPSGEEAGKCYKVMSLFSWRVYRVEFLSVERHLCSTGYRGLIEKSMYCIYLGNTASRIISLILSMHSRFKNKQL